MKGVKEMGRWVNFRVNKSTIKLTINLFNKLHLYGMVSLNPDVKTLGVANLCSDGKLVLFCDWDNVYYSRVMMELSQFQKKYDTGPIYILATEELYDEAGELYGNFHAIGLGKWKYHELMDALEELSIDRNFKRISEYFTGRHHVLRIYPKTKNGRILKDKPKFKNVLYCSTKRECNSALYKFLQQYYNAPSVPKDLKCKWDDSSVYKVTRYGTTSSSFKKEGKKAAFSSNQLNGLINLKVCRENDKKETLKNTKVKV